ncbi:hypothetical protein PMAYCL1PPCAC_21675 [Pristionchus mayeri]|uniref:Uncharacterized protein n=1 Tax=Pristionchus mayeri TaxID=1317129 RepID=A0AAN5I4V0_9BILA|nr:hypothetical protein PMAYCL1PPCAC_21675 [Pristionchus mayeri]
MEKFREQKAVLKPPALRVVCRDCEVRQRQCRSCGTPPGSAACALPRASPSPSLPMLLPSLQSDLRRYPIRRSQNQNQIQIRDRRSPIPILRDCCCYCCCYCCCCCPIPNLQMILHFHDYYCLQLSVYELQNCSKSIHANENLFVI